MKGEMDGGVSETVVPKGKAKREREGERVLMSGFSFNRHGGVTTCCRCLILRAKNVGRRERIYATTS